MADEERMGYPAWEMLPDFGLYMDQLLLFKDRCVPGELTAGMVNSYVKTGLIDRPNGKKYSRESLAQLLMVCHLKQVTSLETLKQLLHPGDGASPRALYERFLEGQRRLEQTLVMREDMSALDCALEAACYQQRCRQLLTAERESGAGD